jgi:hypothetical protein
MSPSEIDSAKAGPSTSIISPSKKRKINDLGSKFLTEQCGGVEPANIRDVKLRDLLTFWLLRLIENRSRRRIGATQNCEIVLKNSILTVLKATNLLTN